MFSRKTFLAVLSLLTAFGRYITSKGCTGNQPLVSGFHFSVLDYQMWSNSNDTTSYPGSAFGEDSDIETLISYEGRIGANYYRGWCSEFNPTVQPFLQIDFKREVIIRQVETQGLQLNYPEDAIRYIRGFWLEYSTNTTASFVNVTEINSNVTKIFSGQNDNNHTASVIQDLPQPITATVVQIYPIVVDSVPNTRACLKVELHGCVPQREEECHSVYPLSCCSYGQPGDMISSVEVTSDDPTDSVPGPVTDILSYYDSSKFWCGNRNILPASATFHFTEEVLLTSVAFHGLDAPLGDDYVTKYSWEYSVENSTVKTYTDLGNNTIFENTREDKFQQTFWTPIHVQTLTFVAHARVIRPCIAFQFFGCKLNEVISQSQMSTTISKLVSTISTLAMSTTQSQGLSDDASASITVHSTHASTEVPITTTKTIVETMTIYCTVTDDSSLSPSPSQDSCGVSPALNDSNNNTPIYVAVVIVIVGLLITVTIIVGKVLYHHYQKRKQCGGLWNTTTSVQPLLVKMKRDSYVEEGSEPRIEVVNLEYESIDHRRHTVSDQDYVVSSIFTNNQSSNNTVVTSKNDPAMVDNPAYSTNSRPPLIDNPAYVAVKAGRSTTTASSHSNN